VVSRLRPVGLFREMSEAVVGDMPGRKLSFSAGGGNGAGRNLVWFRDCDPLDCFGR